MGIRGEGGRRIEETRVRQGEEMVIKTTTARDPPTSINHLCTSMNKSPPPAPPSAMGGGNMSRDTEHVGKLILQALRQQLTQR